MTSHMRQQLERSECLRQGWALSLATDASSGALPAMQSQISFAARAPAPQVPAGELVPAAAHQVPVAPQVPVVEQVTAAEQHHESGATTGASLDVDWKASDWVASIDGINVIIADALLAGTQAQAAMGHLVLLGAGSPADVLRGVREKLSNSDVLGRLATALSTALQRFSRLSEEPSLGRRLSAGSSGEAEELHLKYTQDARSFHKLDIGGLHTFFRGLEGVVGMTAVVRGPLRVFSGSSARMRPPP